MAQSRQREIDERDLRLHGDVLRFGPELKRLVHDRIGSRSRQVGQLLFARGGIVAEQERVNESARAERIARRGLERLRKRLPQVRRVLQMARRGTADIREEGCRRDDSPNDAGAGGVGLGKNRKRRRKWRRLRAARLRGRNRRRLGNFWRLYLWEFSVEGRIQSADAFFQRRMRCHQTADGAAQPIREKQMAGFLGVRSFELRTAREPADFFQGAGQPVGIAGELDGSGVGQKFPLAADGGLDEPAKEDADPADDDQREPKQRQRIFLPSGAEQHSSDHGQAKDPEDQAHEAHIQLHVAVQDVAEFVADDALELIARKHLHAAARHADGGIAGGMTGGKGVDPVLVLEEINLRHGDAGGDRHLFHDVQELALIGRGRIRIDQASIQHLRDRAAAFGQLERLGDAANQNQRSGCRACSRETDRAARG